VTLGEAHVRPFSLSATINDLTIYEPDGKTPMVTLGEAEAKTSAASVWHSRRSSIPFMWMRCPCTSCAMRMAA
jgi:hypothetical protein